jgi:hypothetical protein
MRKQISDWLYQASNGWVTLSTLIVFLLFTTLVLPGQSTQGEGETADAGSPDLSLLYSPDDLYRMAEAYGEQGRNAYVRARFTFDLVWPLVYGAFLTTAISWLYARGFVPDSRWHLANLAPPLGVALDYLENCATSIVMLRYPHPTPVLDTLAPAFTFLKWILVGGSFVLLLIGAVAALCRWYTRKGNRQSHS